MMDHLQISRGRSPVRSSLKKTNYNTVKYKSPVTSRSRSSPSRSASAARRNSHHDYSVKIKPRAVNS